MSLRRIFEGDPSLVQDFWGPPVYSTEAVSQASANQSGRDRAVAFLFFLALVSKRGAIAALDQSFWTLSLPIEWIGQKEQPNFLFPMATKPKK